MTIRPFACGAALFAVAMAVGRFAYTPLLVAMRRDAGLSVTAAGILASANLAGYLIGALAGMHPALKARPKRTVTAGTLGVVALTAAMALPAWAWLPARFLTGICSGIAFVALVSLIFEHAARTASRAGAGIFFSGVGLGIAAVGALVPPFVAFGGSRAAWLFLALVSALVLATALPGLPDVRAEAVRERAPAETGRPRPLGWLTLVYGVEGAVYIIPATFLVALVAESPAIARFAPIAWIAVGLVAAPSTLAWNAIARRTGLGVALAAALALQGVALLAPTFAPPPLDATIVALGLGGTFMGITALATALGRSLRPQQAATVVALLTAFYGIGQIVGPLVATRVVVLTGSYRESFVVAAVALLAATAIFTARLAYEARRG